MGVYLELVNFTKLFNNTTKIPLIINDFEESSEEDKEAFNKMVYTKSTGDLLSNMPACECGEIIGEHNIGVLCHNCRTEVKSLTDQDLEPIIWMRAPNGVHALMNPVMWTMVNDKFTRSGFEIIKWLCDTTYKPQVKLPAIMDAVQALNIPRGFNSFVDNFDAIIDALFELKGFKQKKGVLDPLQVLIREQRDCIFTHYLPLPNKALLVIEQTNIGTYVDPIITGAVDAIRTMVGIDTDLSSFSVRTKENRTVKTIAQLSDFYDNLARTTLAKKEGIFRKHIFGTRSHWSFRGVISSLTNYHSYDELHIPWGIGISLFRIHLTNKLFKKGFTPNAAISFLNEHAQKYNPLLDELFKELIAEAPGSKVPVVFQRNPSLERGSAQSMFITKVKTDPAIPTISLSILSVKGLN